MHINNEHTHTNRQQTPQYANSPNLSHAGCHAPPLLMRRARACTCRQSWPTSHPDSHVTSLGQQSFVTVLLIMLMCRRALAQIKGRRRRRRRRRRASPAPRRRMNILIEESSDSVSFHPRARPPHTHVRAFVSANGRCSARRIHHSSRRFH